MGRREKGEKNDGNKVKQRIKGGEVGGGFDKQTHHSAWLLSLFSHYCLFSH